MREKEQRVCVCVSSQTVWKGVVKILRPDVGVVKGDRGGAWARQKNDEMRNGPRGGVGMKSLA